MDGSAPSQRSFGECLSLRRAYCSTASRARGFMVKQTWTWQMEYIRRDATKNVSSDPARAIIHGQARYRRCNHDKWRERPSKYIHIRLLGRVVIPNSKTAGTELLRATVDDQCPRSPAVCPREAWISVGQDDFLPANSIEAAIRFGLKEVSRENQRLVCNTE